MQRQLLPSLSLVLRSLCRSESLLAGLQFLQVRLQQVALFLHSRWIGSEHANESLSHVIDLEGRQDVCLQVLEKVTLDDLLRDRIDKVAQLGLWFPVSKE